MARRAPTTAHVYTFGCTPEVEDCTLADRRHAQPDSRMPRLAVLLAVAVCALAAHSVASSPSATLGEQGHAPVRVFAFDELPGEPELNRVAFGPDGLLFATSRGGFYTNDGASWRFHPSINAHDSLPSLHIDRAGRVFTAGGKAPLMAVPQADGSYRWQSLASPILPPEAELSWIQCIHADEGAWFQTLGKSSRGYALWHWHEGTWQQIHASVHEPYIGDPAGVFVRDAAGRLQRLAPGAPEEIGPAPTEPIRSISPSVNDSGTWFVATASALHRVTRATCNVWPNQAANYLRTHNIARIFSRADGSLVVATNDGAIVQLDTQGRWRGLTATENGLPEATFLNATFDGADGLWNVYSNQLARIDLAASHTVFDASNGLPAGANALLRHDGALFAGTDHGIFRLDTNNASPSSRWQRMSGIDGRVSALVVRDDTLLAGGLDGVYRFDADASEFRKILLTTSAVVALQTSTALPGVLYFTRYAAGRIARGPDGWEFSRTISSPFPRGSEGSFANNGDGFLWLGSRGAVELLAVSDTPFSAKEPVSTGEGRLRLGAIATSSTAASTASDDDEALPLFVDRRASYRLPPQTEGSGPVILVSSTKPKAAPLIIARGQFWRAPAQHVLLEPLSPNPLAELGANVRVLAAAARSDTELWLAYQPRHDADVVVARFTETNSDHWQRDENATHILVGCRDARALLVEPGVVWLGDSSGLRRIDTTRSQSAPPVVPPLRLTVRPPTRDRTGEAVYALPSFAHPSADTRYETRLAPLDKTWREAVAENRRAFEGLAAGDYTFAVRALLPDGRRSAPVEFAFTLPPAWWQTGWAFGAYVIAVAGGAAGFARWRARRLQRRNGQLESLVAERTKRLTASEHALREAKLAAEAANQAKSAFLANMSHELRTPLNAILGFAQIIRRSPDVPDAHRDRLAVISRNGDHLLALVNEVLDLSKIEAGKLALAPAPFPLSRLLALTADTFSQRAADKGLVFRTSFAADLPAQVEADEAKLRQVLFNLLGNALKFTDRGAIEFNVTPLNPSVSPPRLRFEIVDTGIGIVADDLPRLFTPFHQGRSAPLASPGTGLGLAISQRIVGLMGSTLQVESEPGKGSRFWFNLALPIAHAPANPPVKRTIVDYAGPRRRLLVVDDEITNRDVLRGLLEPLGFDIEECVDGESCVSAFQRRPADAILLDLRMPGGPDGFATARALRALPGGAALAIIAVSASVFEEDRQTAIDAGCDDFVPKPFNEERLFTALGECLHLTWTFADVAPETAPLAQATARPPLPASETEALLDLVQRGEIRNFRQQLKLLGERHPACAATIQHLDQLAAGFQLGRLRQELAAARESSS